MPVTGRAVSATVLLFIGAGLALLAVLVHYEFMRIYGDVTGTAFEGLTWGLTAGPSGLGLSLVAVVTISAFMLSTRRWMRLTAVAIPVLMLAGMFAVTPSALGQRLETQYVSSPQCVIEGTQEPMASADREAQQVFDSISHIGHFSGGGIGGVGGCTRGFKLSGDADVLEHYRGALAAAGWEVVEDDGRQLRAHLNGRAFAVMPCPGGGVIWAGSEDDSSFGQGRPEFANTEICPHDL
ncbi:hypothetical protein FDW83_14585 [Pseudarthrobacter sp. NamE2]|uniref:hypothetical protein n=1 Tax=Pseudarthrobacter sp. NamE2 TaxID=2576838 RepID=UPI0010FF5CD6|nr:hypothetical protein [Pseudarthrobacter sp. NamE2]TLM81954.1 hypothetical protein FDW83_14585 [Pseudarthrobacter sp. NamE2]